MKLQLLAVILFAFVSILHAQTTDKEAILQIAKAETDSYYNRDSVKWLSYRVQSKEASVTFVASNGYNYIKGWDSIISGFGPAFKQASTGSFKVEISDPVIKVNGNLAWAEYKQLITAKATDTTTKRTSIEMRVFNKVNGKWKILSQITTTTSPVNQNSDVAIEEDLNTAGYKLISANKIDDAIEVFKLNVKMHSNSWNTYDSLGEAYAIQGDKAKAIENYETSVKLNPKNEGGVAALKKLSQ